MRRRGRERERKRNEGYYSFFFRLYFWKFRVVLLGPMLPKVLVLY